MITGVEEAMQRRSTKNTRGPNVEEKRFQSWLKDQSCAVGGHGITEVHHCKGATFKHKKTLIGHWFCLPLSQSAHSAYHAGTKVWQSQYGMQAKLWLGVYDRYLKETGNSAPIDIVEQIWSLS